MHVQTWRPLVLTSLLVADKMQLDPSKPGGNYVRRLS